MSLIRVYNGVKGGLRMVNLFYVSTVQLKDNEIKLYKNGDRDSLIGSFIVFEGGKTSTESITFNSNEEAKKEFNNIIDVLKKKFI